MKIPWRSIKNNIFQGLTNRVFLISLGVTVAILLIGGNLVLSWYFADHYLPGSKIGTYDVSYLNRLQANEKIEKKLSGPVKLNFAGQIESITLDKLGADYQVDDSLANLADAPRPWLPMLAWWPADRTRELQSTISLDIVTEQAERMAAHYSTEPTNAKLSVDEGHAKISLEVPGHTFEPAELVDQLSQWLRQPTEQVVQMHGNEIAPEIRAEMLRPALASLQQKAGTSITLTYLENVYRPTIDRIGSWFSLDDQHKLQLSSEELAKFVSSIAQDIDLPATETVVTVKDGVETGRQPGRDGKVIDQEAAIAAITKALEDNQKLEYQLEVKTVTSPVTYIRTFTPRLPTYSYCVAARGVDESHLSEFASVIAQTLADPRGWSLGGKIKFQQVQSGCGMTIWLATPSSLPQFSSGCSALYSCRVGRNVIINFDPWSNATPAWHSQSGSLADYRALVINHEVGHWLGFGHKHCGGAGQPAPVMQQQSISLEGCNINSWPLQSELQQLQSMKGL